MFSDGPRPSMGVLDRALRGAAWEDRCAAVVAAAGLLSDEATPQLVAKVFLRLAEVFRADDSNRVRVWVVWLFTACSHLLPVVGERRELLRRVLRVLDSTDATARALTWRLLAAMAAILPDILEEADLPTKAQRALLAPGHAEEERAAVMFAMVEITKVSRPEFQALTGPCLTAVRDLGTPPGLRTQVLRWLRECDSPELAARPTVEALLHTMAEYPTTNMVCPLLELLSHLAVRTRDHALRLQLVEALLHFVERDARPAVHAAALRGVLRLAHTPLLRTLPWLWLSVLRAVLARLTEVSHGTVHFLALHVLLCSTVTVVPCLMESRETARTLEDLVAACQAALWHPAPPLVLAAGHTLLGYLQHRQAAQGAPLRHTRDVLDLCHAAAFAALKRQGLQPCPCAPDAPVPDGDRRCASHAWFQRLLRLALRVARVAPAEAAQVQAHLLLQLSPALCRQRQLLVLQALHRLRPLVPTEGPAATDAVRRARTQRVLACLQASGDDAAWPAGLRLVFASVPREDDALAPSAAASALGGPAPMSTDPSTHSGAADAPPCVVQLHRLVDQLCSKHQCWRLYLVARAALQEGWPRMAERCLAPLGDAVEGEDRHAWLQGLLAVAQCQAALAVPSPPSPAAPPAPGPGDAPEPPRRAAPDFALALRRLSDAALRLRCAVGGGGGAGGRGAFQSRFLQRWRATLQAAVALSGAAAATRGGAAPGAAARDALLCGVAAAFRDVGAEWAALRGAFIDLDELSEARLARMAAGCRWVHHYLTSDVAALPDPSFLPLSLLSHSQEGPPLLDVACGLAAVAEGLPPFYFSLAPATALHVTVTPAGTVTVPPRSAVVLHVEGTVRQPATPRGRRAHAVGVALRCTPAGSQPPALALAAAEVRQEAELGLTEGLFAGDVVLPFPEAGRFTVTPAVAVIDDRSDWRHLAGTSLAAIDVVVEP